ncbi:LOB domain-containing protein 36-like [Juglans microcarpa x Juglans regia]|uniref:LOB domain-containing protein 36-like n=1 Tax=Juglans microcarpa x Juglans regia TaxID=2249226 RepID=UPI001B7F4019|nr:LOB domain-containing protein 36-like [Juglans microcarpa x Juglans regia]XP_041004370.1 LOB domain-containing protein 36-like [Juglans microcarpa x Juglans regia]XP_041004378.1 LOB domain-containing protein 36-like [Juglans microcarpa x Juglans regia]XP_041004386.1 LOB domain-containing protein 36-like [Juglans microcarpa x Juglans regia]
MSSSNSPCAACKCMRRKCTQECSFAPYFPPDQTQKFANIHKVFGACNVSKLLNELHPSQREDAVKSLAYEAETRLLDPVYGCVGLVSMLQHRMRQIQNDIVHARRELASYIGPQAAMLPVVQQYPGIGYMPQQQHPGNPSSSVVLPQQQHPGNPSSSAVLPQQQHPGNPSSSVDLPQQQHPGNPSSSAVLPYNMSPMLGIPIRAPTRGGALVIREPRPHPQHQHHQYQLFEAQQLAAALAAAAAAQQELLLAYEQQQQLLQHMHLHPDQQQPELVMFNSGLIDPAALAGSSVTASGFNQMNAAMPPSLTLGAYENLFEIELQQGEHHDPSDHHHQLEAQLLLQQQQAQAHKKGKQIVQQPEVDSKKSSTVGLYY